MTETHTPADPIPLALPLFWPVAMVAGMEKAKADLALKNLEFIQEEIKLHGGLKAKVASPNVVRLDLRTMVLRDYGRPGGNTNSRQRALCRPQGHDRRLSRRPEPRRDAARGRRRPRRADGLEVRDRRHEGSRDRQPPRGADRRHSRPRP